LAPFISISKGPRSAFPIGNRIIVFVHPVEWFERGQNESDASLIKELGYEEPEALIVARYQECAIVMTIAGIIALAVISRVWPGVDFRRLC
jgi:hypothetical protein